MVFLLVKSKKCVRLGYVRVIIDSKFKLLPAHVKPKPAITHCIIRHLSWRAEFNSLLHELGFAKFILEEV